jgi:hypothetical protein
MKKTTISNTDDCQFTTLFQSTSAAMPVGLLPKMAKFCHTFNRLLVGVDTAAPYGGCNFIHLRSVFGHWSLVVGRWLLVVGCWLLVVGHWLLVIGHWLLVVGHWSVHNKGSQALGGFPPKG